MKIIILPGLDGTGLMLKEFSEEISHFYDTEILTYPLDVALSYDELAETIFSQLPQNEDYIILAESYAGPLAIKIASQKPSGLIAIIFAASFAKKPNNIPYLLTPLINIAPFSSKTLTRMARPITFGRWGNAELDKLTYEAINTVNRNVLIKHVYDIMKVDTIETLKTIDIAMLYILPDSDKLVHQDSAKLMVAANPQISIIDIEGPHFILQSKPSECVNIIDNFISQLV